MKEFQQVIEQALTRLYQRINGPTATDKIHYQAALKAVRNLPQPEAATVVATGTIGAPEGATLTPVQPVSLDEALAQEKATHPLTGANVNTVQALVEQGKVTAAEALAFEQASEFPRKTLIAWLTSELGDEGE